MNNDVAELRADITAARMELRNDITVFRTDSREDIATLRREVTLRLTFIEADLRRLFELAGEIKGRLSAR
jgi:hypothetical protein